MTKLHIDSFTTGLPVACENCGKTTTIQEDGELPNGWWMLLDGTKTGGIFCMIDCIYHYISEKVGSGEYLLHKTGMFN